MTDTAEQFSMSMYPSAIERSAAMLEEIDRLRAEVAGMKRYRFDEARKYDALLAEVARLTKIIDDAWGEA